MFWTSDVLHSCCGRCFRSDLLHTVLVSLLGPARFGKSTVQCRMFTYRPMACSPSLACSRPLSGLFDLQTVACALAQTERKTLEQLGTFHPPSPCWMKVRSMTTRLQCKVCVSLQGDAAFFRVSCIQHGAHCRILLGSYASIVSGGTCLDTCLCNPLFASSDFWVCAIVSFADWLRVLCASFSALWCLLSFSGAFS